MMNYREEAIVEQDAISRLTTGVRHSNRLSEDLSRMEIVIGDRAASHGGIFSRIKSTLFSSHESSIRCDFVASCRLDIASSNDSLFLGIKREGTCTLLRAQGVSATEVGSVSIPHSADGYSISSVALGRNQGHLCAISASEGRILMLTIKGDTMGIKKTITLPITAPMTGVFLNERRGVMELYVILEQSHIVVIPDTSKSTEYFFVFTKGLRHRVKLTEFASITQESISLAWENRAKDKTKETVYLRSAALIDSRLNPIETLEEFKAVYLHEKAVELVLIRHPSMSVSSIARAESLARIQKLVQSSSLLSPFASLIEEESENLEPVKISYEISEVFFDEISQKTIIYFHDGRISEIVPTHSLLERYLNTFLSASFVYGFLNQRLSRDSVLNLFGAAKEWVNLFACASVAEAIGSTNLDLVTHPEVIRSLLEGAITGQLKDHLGSCLNIISYVSQEKRFELVETMISTELNTRSFSQLGSGNLFVSNLSTLIGSILRIAKYYVVYATYSHAPVKLEMERLIPKLSILNHIVSHYTLPDDLRTHVIDRCRVSTVSELLNRMQLVFCMSEKFFVDVGYLAACTEVASHSSFRKYHLSRQLSASNMAADKERAWEQLESIETEMSLYVDYLGFENQGCAEFRFYQSVRPWFAGDYAREKEILSKLAALSSEEGLKNKSLKLLIEKAIANADWARTRDLLTQIPSSQTQDRQDTVRLMCTEARIRNQLGAVFDLVKENKDIIAMIVYEIKMEIDNSSDPGPLYFQIYTISVFVEDYAAAARAVMQWYDSLCCPYTCPDYKGNDDLFHGGVRARLDQQLRALLLCRGIHRKATYAVAHDHNIISLVELKKRIILVEGLIAFLSFVDDENSLEALIDTKTGCVSVMQLCRTVAALGLGVISFEIAQRHRVDIFKSSICPLIELVMKCEADPAFLPPCRLEGNDCDNILMPEVVPAMAFVRSDASGPIRAGGSQLRALLRTLEHVVRKANSKTITLEAIEYVFLVRNRSKIYSFLIDLVESQNGWTDLLKLYMRKELYSECVSLVETHVKFWRPDPTETDLGTMVINVPLLVQLQRALAMVEEQEVSQLSKKLDSCLETLKSTLSEVSQRLI